MEILTARLREAITFIQPYTPLINSHMVTFFTEKLWNKYVPSPIRKELDERTENITEVFSNAASDNSQFKELNTFLESVSIMDIAQHQCLNVKEFKEILGLENNDFKRPSLKEFMKEKKSHEVEVLVELLATLTYYLGVSHVVEIGDGKGYSSSLLALQHGIKVLGIEGSEVVAVGAEKRKTKLLKYWNNYRKDLYNMDDSNTKSFYRQIHKEVSINTDIGKCVQQKFPEDWPIQSLGISGLHTCGNLSPISMELFFKSNPLPKFLINVGCCYHLLECSTSEEKNNTSFSGFPLSNFLKQNEFHLSRNARMMSLQAPTKLLHLKKPPAKSLMYRAVLEQLLDETFGQNCPTNRDVGRIGGKCKNFVEYVHKAAITLGCEFKLNDSELENYYSKFAIMERKLHIYFMIRVMLAPVIEGIILLDRLLFIKEKGIEKSYLIKLFDPIISPRCYGIVAIREK